MDDDVLKKEFVFEDDEYELTFWIGRYADDKECIGRLAGYDNAELLHNCLVCGRTYYDKIKKESGCSLAYEIISITDVIAFHEGVKAFREKKIDHFGPYPEIGLLGNDWSYFKMELNREIDGDHFVAAVFQPYGVIEHASSIVTNEWLQKLETYFAEIVDLYPIRPFDSEVKVIKGVGEDLIIAKDK